jgi:hypothetical protein
MSGGCDKHGYRKPLLTDRKIEWIIAGGESTQGAGKARPFDLAWARSAVAQCKAAGVPVFVKQLGSNAQEIAYPTNVGESEKARWHSDGWTSIHEGTSTHWRKYYRLKERAGADPAEWPEDLRVQCFPE